MATWGDYTPTWGGTATPMTWAGVLPTIPPEFVPPEVHPTTWRIYEALGPAIIDPDPPLGYPLLRWLDGIGRQLGEADDVVRPASGDGWAWLLDPGASTQPYLRWLGQFVGVDVSPDLDDEDARSRIRDLEGWRRGTPRAITAAARRWLTGSQRIDLIEREHGDPYRARLVAYVTEVVNADRFHADVAEAKPAGIVLTTEVRSGATYQQLAEWFPGDVSTLEAAFERYDQMRDYLPFI